MMYEEVFFRIYNHLMDKNGRMPTPMEVSTEYNKHTKGQLNEFLTRRLRGPADGWWLHEDSERGKRKPH